MSLTKEREDELREALVAMKRISNEFYDKATRLNVHPFIEFTGLINEYIQCCAAALNDGIDYADCNKHLDNHLPVPSHSVSYINSKLECIFTGRSVVSSGFHFELPVGYMPVEGEVLETDKHLVPIPDMNMVGFAPIGIHLLAERGILSKYYMCPIRKVS